MYTSYNCGNCRKTVSKDAKSCPHCKARLGGIRCQSCKFVGSESDFKEDTCPKCGGQVSTQAYRVKLTPCPKCGKLMPDDLNCPNCGWTNWGLIGGFFAVGMLFVSISLAVWFWIEDAGWAVFMCGAIGSFLLLLAGIAILNSGLVARITATPAFRWLFGLGTLIVGVNLTAVCVWVSVSELLERQKVMQPRRELAQEAAAAIPQFTFRHYRELDFVQRDKLRKSKEKFDSPFFAIEGEDTSSKKGIWAEVPEGTDRLENAKTILYVQKLGGSINDTLIVCFVDRAKPERRRIVDVVEKTESQSELPSWDRFLKKAYAVMREE